MDEDPKLLPASTGNGERNAEELLSRARRMRRQASDAESLLWRHLRNRQMLGYKFRRQAVIEPYIVDFACLEAMLVIEADGGQHTAQGAYDARRTARLEAMGYKVLRFWNHQILVETDTVLERIASELLD